MIIGYKNKIIKDIKDGCIDAELIEYEIAKSDLQQLALATQTDDTYKINRIFLFKDNVIDLVVDNIDANKIVEGVIRDDGKAYLDQYIVKSGLHELIIALSLHN